MPRRPRVSDTSVIGVFIRVLCVVFVVETIVMYLLSILMPQSVPELLLSFIDAAILTVVAAPLLWSVIIAPILREHANRLAAERELSQTQAKLQLAAEIQMKLLPEAAPVIPGCDLAASLNSAESTSGDFYDFIPMRDGSLAIVIADVSGHGIDSALLVAAASAYLRALTSMLENVGDILTRLNEFLVARSRKGRFITMFLGRFDPATRSLSYAAAGHRSYLFEGQEQVTTLKGDAPPLGVLAGITVSSSRIDALKPGSTLLLLTDGIEESAAPGGEIFGRARVMELIQAHPHLSSQDLLDLLHEEARRFTGGAVQSDDMTAVALKVL